MFGIEHGGRERKGILKFTHSFPPSLAYKLSIHSFVHQHPSPLQHPFCFLALLFHMGGCAEPCTGVQPTWKSGNRKGAGSRVGRSWVCIQTAHSPHL